MQWTDDLENKFADVLQEREHLYQITARDYHDWQKNVPIGCRIGNRTDTTMQQLSRVGIVGVN